MCSMDFFDRSSYLSIKLSRSSIAVHGCHLLLLLISTATLLLHVIAPSVTFRLFCVMFTESQQYFTNDLSDNKSYGQTKY